MDWRYRYVIQLLHWIILIDVNMKREIWCSLICAKYYARARNLARTPFIFPMNTWTSHGRELILLAIGHFILGYSTILFIAIIYRWRNPLVYPLAYLGGLWAMFPDLYKLSYIPVQVKDIVLKLHSSDAANLFFLHNYMDQLYLYDLPDDVSVFLLFGLLLTLIYGLNNSRQQS